MSCKKTTSLALVTLAVLAALAGGVYYCWTIRELPSARREACKQAARRSRRARTTRS
jgi:ABC-type transport system involved in cytochrome c biogenesis permease subunit